MARKLILDVDPGVGDALAICLALNHPGLEVVAVTATGGNVSPRQASRNVQAIVEHVDPARWPRIGFADENQPLRTDGRDLWGADGLCGAELRWAELHQQHSSPRVLAEEIRAAPGEVTIIAGGPLSNLATALQLEPDLATQIGHLIVVGGTLSGAGDVTAAAEFNIFCDAEAAQRVFRSRITTTLLPREATAELCLTFDVLRNLPAESTPVGRLLRAIVPGALAAYRQRRGVEGMYAPEAAAVAVALHPEIVDAEPLHCDVETEGVLTHGAVVIDRRRRGADPANMDVVSSLDASAALDFIMRGLQ
jgi:inosine-uridine nucleoside N-ribohydrolase